MGQARAATASRSCQTLGIARERSVQSEALNWLHRVARGHSTAARRTGQCLFILSVLLVPFLYGAFLKVFSAPGRGVVVHVLCTVMCVVWLVFANDIRKFFNGERLINQLTSTDIRIRTIGSTSRNTFARWSTAVFDSLVLAGIGWFAYASWVS